MREWTRDEIQRIGYRVVDLIADHLSTLPSEPVFRPVPPALARQFLADARPGGAASRPTKSSVCSKRPIEPYPFGNGHPRFWGWVNSPPAVMGVFADALAAAMNPSCAGGNHAAIYVERQVLNWFRDMLGFPDTSMGLLVSGGSMATMTALAVARHVKSGVDVRADGLRTRRGRSRSTCHPRRTAARARRSSCSDSAARRSGRSRPSADYRMDVDALDAALAGRPRASTFSRSPSSPPPGRPTPARSTTSRRSPTSAGGTTSGCTWTRRTAGRPILTE